MMYEKIKYILVILTLVSCSKPKPNEDQIIGVWKSLDGVIIKLKENQTAEIINYPLNLSNSSFKGMLNGKGSWKIDQDKKDLWWNIQILAENDKIIPELQSKGIALELFINQSGLLGNGSEIKSLFIWKGDPDVDDRYEFKKKID